MTCASAIGPTHFYRANSNLYRATRAAFAAAHGEDRVPDGEAFLRYFGDRGCWLVDLADRPVNRLPPAQRRLAVERGVERLADLIRAEQPEAIVVVKRDIATAVEKAVSLARARRRRRLSSCRFPSASGRRSTWRASETSCCAGRRRSVNLVDALPLPSAPLSRSVQPNGTIDRIDVVSRPMSGQ